MTEPSPDPVESGCDICREPSLAGPSGEGFHFIFDRDGSYETGAVINSTVAGCTMRLLGNETGTIVQDGEELTVYHHRIKTHVENSCGDDGERTQGEATRVMSYYIEEDDTTLARHRDATDDWALIALDLRAAF